MMVSDWKFWCLILVAVAALLLTYMNIDLRSELREQQAELVQRQQFINESSQLSQFNTQFIQALAQLAAQTNDESIRDLLAANGVTFKVNAPAEATAEEENPDE
jgi:uncharacterized protein YpmS